MSTSQMPVEQARALALLAEGATGQEAAKQSGLTLGRIVQLARRQGWNIHPTTGLAIDPAQDDNKPVLPEDVAAVAAAWTGRPRIVIEARQGDVDELLADARDCDDRHVQAALVKADAAIDKLRDVYESVSERIAEEQARQAARDAALAEVAELERKLAAARQRAKDAGAKPARTATKTAEGVTDKEIRAWARQHDIDVPKIGRVSQTIRDQYEAAHRAVAS